MKINEEKNYSYLLKVQKTSENLKKCKIETVYSNSSMIQSNFAIGKLHTLNFEMKKMQNPRTILALVTYNL